MSQPSILKSPSSGEGDSTQAPAEPQLSQHDSDLGASQQYTQTSNLDRDETESSKSFPILSISKITINEEDNGKTAEEIISNIIHQAEKLIQQGETTRQKRRGTDGPINPQMQASDVQGESVISQGAPNTSESQSTDGDNNGPGTSQHSVLDAAKAVQGATLKELSLTKCVSDKLKTDESCFHVKLFEFTTPTHCEMSPAIEAIIEPRQLPYISQTISYIIFFYRDMVGPEIFAAVSGMAYLHVDQRSCPEFPKKIARRLLEPTTVEFETRNVTGDTSQDTKKYAPGAGIINIWDVIDVVVHKYTARPKEMSSIVEFCNKRPLIAIKQLSVEVRTRFPSIFAMQKIISHFATIDRNERTYQFGSSTRVEEKDDEAFAMFDLMQEEHNRETIKRLQNELYEGINNCLNNENEECIQLSCDDLDLGLKASEYRLFLDTKSKRDPIETWRECPPTFRDVLDALKSLKPLNKISGKILHTDVKMSLRNAKGKLCPKKPITSFIQSYLGSSLSTPYYFWRGKWLKIKLEYFQILDDSFKSIMERETIISASVMPLPWPLVREKTSSKLPAETLPLASLHGLLTDFLPNKEGDVDSQGPTGTDGKVEEVKDDEHDENLLQEIRHRLNTPLTEGMYNDCYVLLDKIISMTGTPLITGFLVGDRICIKNIEMFDIIMYNQTRTYIIHVMRGFDNNNTRVVASQIRKSAKILFEALTSNKAEISLDNMWDGFVKGGSEQNRLALQSKLKEMTKEGFMSLFKEREIVYVLAVRDKSQSRTTETAEALMKQLQSKPPEKCENILQLLVAKMYMQKIYSHHVVTDKLRSVKRENFLKDMMGTNLDKHKQSDKEEKTYDNKRIDSKAASSTDLESSTDNLTGGFDKHIPHASSSAGSPRKSLTVTEDASPRHSAGSDTQALGQDLWVNVYKILKDQLKYTKSSIVKLDLLSLFSHFRNYQIGKRKFQLKVCFIPNSVKQFK